MPRSSPSWTARFLAVVRYELLWNLRKKKFLAMIVVAFALVTLALFLPFLIAPIFDQTVEANPDYVLNSVAGMGTIIFFLFGLVTAMNSISGEFESGTIVPLLSKPVSRTTIFTGKLFGIFLTLLVTYVVIMVYQVVGGTLLYGPQNNLHLSPLILLGMILSTFVWVGIVLALSSASKSSMMTALVAFGIWIGLGIVLGIIAVFSGENWFLTYVPGAGASGYMGGPPDPSSPIAAEIGAIGTGTDSIGTILINYILHPSADVTFYSTEITVFGPGGSPIINYVLLYSEALSFVLLRAIAVALTYFAVFALIAWYALKRAQVAE